MSTPLRESLTTPAGQLLRRRIPKAVKANRWSRSRSQRYRVRQRLVIRWARRQGLRITVMERPAR